MPSNSGTSDPYKYLGIIPNSDGTIIRLPDPNISLIPEDLLPAAKSLLTKDITINPKTNTSARFYVPPPNSNTKLPLIIWFRGGGFVLYSATSTFLHNSCVNLAIQLQAFVVSIEYRNAPEHRLPTAYGDAVDALNWIKSLNDEWLIDFANFNKCFIAGSSAGANIAYNVSLRAGENIIDGFHPLVIKGFLHQPFFGGIERTKSELKLANDLDLPFSSTDLLWELASPVGANRNHEYCNPTTESAAKIKKLGWKIFAGIGDEDPLMDRQIEFVKMLKKMDLQVESHIMEGGGHGVELSQPSNFKELFGAYSSFIAKC